MKNTRKFCLLLMAFILCAGLISCGDSKESSETESALVSDSSSNAQALTVIYVPGFMSGGYEQEKPTVIIRQIFQLPKSYPVEVEDWCEQGLTWKQAVDKADKSTDLTKKIEKFSDKKRELILIGHSLGARYIIRTLYRLRDKDIRIRQTVLLGAAIDSDDNQIEKALTVCKETVSVVNPMDGQLVRYRRHQEGKNALGTGCRYYLPKHLCEVQTESSELHESVFYLAQYKIIKSKFTGQNYVIVPQVDYNIPQWCDRSKLMVEEDYKGWALCNIKKNNYAILDRLSFIRAQGVETAIKESFEKVKRQLDDNIPDGEIEAEEIVSNIKIDNKYTANIVQKNGSPLEFGWKTDNNFDGWKLQRKNKEVRILDPAFHVRAYLKADKKNELETVFVDIIDQLNP